MMNVPRKSLDTRARRCCPRSARRRSRTLADERWVAINTVIEEALVRELIPKLTAAARAGIVEYPLNKIVDVGPRALGQRSGALAGVLPAYAEHRLVGRVAPRALGGAGRSRVAQAVVARSAACCSACARDLRGWELPGGEVQPGETRRGRARARGARGDRARGRDPATRRRLPAQRLPPARGAASSRAGRSAARSRPSARRRASRGSTPAALPDDALPVVPRAARRRARRSRRAGRSAPSTRASRRSPPARASISRCAGAATPETKRGPGLATGPASRTHRHSRLGIGNREDERSD